MQTRYWILIIALAGGLFYFFSHIDQNTTNKTASSADELSPEENFQSENTDSPQVTNSPASSTEKEETPAEPSKSLIETTQAHLKEMDACLGIQTDPLQVEDEEEVGFFTLNQAFQNEFGHVLSRQEPWQAVDIQTPEGEIRRIVVEDSAGGESLRKLTHYKVNANGEEEPLPLSEEQSQNPSASLVASLESEGEVVQRSKVLHIFYRDTQIVLDEVDGKIRTLEVNRNGNSFKCQNFSNPANSHCTCE